MKIQRIISCLAVFCLMLGLLCGCTLFERDYPVTVGTVEIKRQPERVATLSQAAASSIYALGYKSYLVGAPTAFLTGEETGVTDLGSPVMPNEEALLELAPDVLITATALEAELLEKLRLRDVTVVTLETPDQYSEIAPYYTELSKLFLGKKKYTEGVEVYLTEMERVLTELKTANQDLAKKAVVFMEDGYVATGDTLAGEALERVGIPNIAAAGKDYIMAEADVIAANPDVIFCKAGMSEAFFANEAYKEVAAIQNAAVYEIDIIALAYAGEGFAAVLHDMSTYLNPQIDIGSETLETSSKESTSSNLVEKNLGNILTGTVNITIPLEFLDLGDEEFDYKLTDKDKANGFTSIKKNSDGSATYTIKQKKYDEFIKSTKAETKEYFDTIATDGTFASVNSVEYNDDFSEIILIVEKQKFENSLDSMAIVGCGLTSCLYQMFDINAKKECVVKVKDSVSGEIFYTEKYPKN